LKRKDNQLNNFNFIPKIVSYDEEIGSSHFSIILIKISLGLVFGVGFPFCLIGLELSS